MNITDNHFFITQHKIKEHPEITITLNHFNIALNLLANKVASKIENLSLKKIPYEKVKEQAKIHFLGRVREISKDVGESLRQHCSLAELHLNMGELLFTKLEKYTEQYLADHPDDEQFKKNWQDFRFNYAKYMSTDSESFFKLSKNCLDELQKKLFDTNHFDPLIFKNELTKAQALKDVFNKVFKTDIRLLLVPVTVLAEISSLNQNGEYQVQTFIDPVIEANNILAKTLCQNIPWVVDHCLSLLRVHLNSSCVQVRDSTEIMIKSLKDLKEEILPNLQKIAMKSSRAKNNERILEKITEFINLSLMPGKSDLPGSVSYTMTTKDAIIKDYLFPSFSPFIIQYIDFDIEELKLSQSQFKEKQKELKVIVPWVNQTIADIDQTVELKKTMQECSRYLEAFITTPYFIYLATASVSNEFFLNPKSKRFIGKSGLIPKARLDDRDINALAAAINRTSNTSGSRKKRKGKNAAKKQNRKNRKKTTTTPLQTEEKNTKTNEAPPVPSDSQVISISTHPQQVSHQLASMVGSLDNPLRKHAIRHAHMYLEDLIAASQGLPQASTESSKLFYLIMIMQSAYFHIEQVLNYERLSNPDCENTKLKGHNLKTLLNELGCKSIDEKLPNELYLANYWIRETYEQLLKRASWNVPGALKSVKAVYEGTAEKEEIIKIQDYCERVSLFTKQLPHLAENEVFSHAVTPMESSSFEQTLKFEVEKCDKLKSACQNLLRDIPLFLEPTLKQTVSHIELVKGCLQELNKEKISSGSLSFLVRSLIFWENTILEEMLQVLHGLKTGMLVQSHNIVELYTASMDEKVEKMEKFVHKHCNNVHNISRYPFAPHKGSEKIHHLLLESEFIRERPELATGFKLEKNISELNYIELKEQSNFEQIMSKLKKHSDKVYQIIENALDNSKSYT